MGACFELRVRVSLADIYKKNILKLDVLESQ
jgi:hypothetical protein